MKNKNTLIGCGIVAFLVIMVVMLSAIILVAGRGSHGKIGGVMSHVGGDRIGLLYITGVISSGSSTPSGLMGGGSSGSDSIVRLLRKSSENSNLKAIIIRINSPGGSAAASQEVYNEVMRIRKKTDIKVIVSLGDVAASGGYYIASAGEQIVANPATITASIGVIMKYMNFEGLMDKVGMEAIVMKSGKLKDMGSPYREMTEEERELMQASLGNIHEQFIADVAKGRNMDIEDVRKVADGRILTGEQALDAGLIDTIGGLQDAIEIAGELTGLGTSPEVELLQKESPFSFLLNTLSTVNPGTNAEKAMRAVSQVLLMDPALSGEIR